jgi:hypothetical protein
MAAQEIVKVRCSAAYKDGTYLFGAENEDELLLADSFIVNSKLPNSDYKAVELRILVPCRKAEALVNGMRSGVLQLYVESMKSEVG